VRVWLIVYSPVSDLLYELRATGCFCAADRPHELVLRHAILVERLRDIRLRPGSCRDRVVVVYDGGWKPGKVAGAITIRTDDPWQPAIRVPYKNQRRGPPASAGG
jgi:hypothetical protein